MLNAAKKQNKKQKVTGLSKQFWWRCATCGHEDKKVNYTFLKHLGTEKHLNDDHCSLQKICKCKDGKKTLYEKEFIKKNYLKLFDEAFRSCDCEDAKTLDVAFE